MEVTLNAIFYISRAARLLPMISNLDDSGFFGFACIIIVVLIDIIFFFCLWDLSGSSTKEENNN